MPLPRRSLIPDTGISGGTDACKSAEQSNARELRVARFFTGKVTRRNRVIGAVRAATNVRPELSETAVAM